MQNPALVVDARISYECSRQAGPAAYRPVPDYVFGNRFRQICPAMIREVNFIGCA
jgi:hypothetical protein